MAQPRTHLILNPHAGSGAHQEEVIEAIRRLEPTAIHETREGGDGRRLARQAIEAGAQRVVAAGGDGTLSEVINGVMSTEAEVEVGLVPAGTANDFAKTLEIPPLIEQAVDIIELGYSAPTDLLRIESDGETFFGINSLTGGFSAEMSQSISDDVKGWFGALSYLFSATANIRSLDQFEAELIVDGERERHELYNFVVANGHFLGGGHEVPEWGGADDGQLELFVVPCLPTRRLLTAYAHNARGADDELLRPRRIRTLEVEGSPQLPVTIDGEVGYSTPLRCEVAAAAVRVIRPQPGG